MSAGIYVHSYVYMYIAMHCVYVCVCVMVCCLRVCTGLYLLCYLQTLKVSILLRQLLSACYNSPTDVSSFSHNNSGHEFV